MFTVEQMLSFGICIEKNAFCLFSARYLLLESFGKIELVPIRFLVHSKVLCKFSVVNDGVDYFTALP